MADSQNGYYLAGYTGYEMPQRYNVSSGNHNYAMQVSSAKFTGLSQDIFPSSGGIRMTFYSTTGTRYVIRNFGSIGTIKGSFGLNDPKTIILGVDNTSSRNCVASFAWDIA